MTPTKPAQKIAGQWPLAYIGIAAVALALIIGLSLWLMRGSHLEIRGEVQQVRTLASDESHSILIADFRGINAADYPFVVRSVTMSIVDSNGRQVDGTTVAEIDARRFFEYYSHLGAKNDTLLPRESFAPRQSKVRMIAASFDVPESELQKRKSLIIRIQELDGVVSEIRK